MIGGYCAGGSPCGMLLLKIPKDSYTSWTADMELEPACGWERFQIPNTLKIIKYKLTGSRE